MAALVVAPESGFDSYVSEAEADAYMDAIGNTSWAGLDIEDKRRALRRGSQYIGAQRPLAEYVDPVVHPNIKAATNEAAIRARLGTLYKDQPAQAVKAVTVGPIKREFVDPKGSVQNRFEIIDDLLDGLTARTLRGGSLYFERA